MRKSKLPRLMAGQFCFCGDLRRGVEVEKDRLVAEYVATHGGIRA